MTSGKSVDDVGKIVNFSDVNRELPHDLENPGEITYWVEMDGLVAIRSHTGYYHLTSLAWLQDPYNVGDRLTIQDLRAFDDHNYHTRVVEQMRNSGEAIRATFTYHFDLRRPLFSTNIPQTETALIYRQQTSAGISSGLQVFFPLRGPTRFWVRPSTYTATISTATISTAMDAPRPSLSDSESSESEKSDSTVRQALATGVLSTGNPVQNPKSPGMEEVVECNTRKTDEPSALLPYTWLPTNTGDHAESSRTAEKRATVADSNLDSSDDDSDSESRVIDLRSQLPPQPSGVRLPSGVAGKRLPIIPFTDIEVVGIESDDDDDAADLSSSTISTRAAGKQRATDSSDNDFEISMASLSTEDTVSNLASVSPEPVESSSRAGSKKRRKNKNKKKSKSKGGRKFNDQVALHAAESSGDADKVRGAEHSDGEIDLDYIFDLYLPLRDLSYANLEDMIKVMLPDEDWKAEGPYYVCIIECDTSGINEVIPKGVKRYRTRESYIGPIHSRQEANDATFATIHHRARELFEAYYPGEQLLHTEYAEFMSDNGCYTISTYHDQFYIVVKTVDKEPDEDDIIVPHDFSRQERTRYIVTACLSGPLRTKVVPYDEPELHVEICSTTHNASKYAVGLFMIFSKYLIHTQDIQQCVLKMMKIAEEAEEIADEDPAYPERFNWSFEHVFDSMHKLPENEGAGLKTKIHISVRGGRSDRT